MKCVENIAFESDAGIAFNAAIGLIVLATDYTIEHEWRQIFSQIDGVGLYHSRILNDDEVTPRTLRAMAPGITDCAATFTPGTALDVVAYGCTSATIALGEQAVFDAIHLAKPEAACTTPITAALAAMQCFKARRIAVLTPYSASVNKLVAAYIEEQGLEVAIFGSFNEPYDSKVARITAQSVKDSVSKLVRDTALDAVFISCTSVRTLDIIKPLEDELGIAVTSSNQAMAWHALRLAGLTQSLPELGSLFTQAAAH